jgi:hypothetical protein
MLANFCAFLFAFKLQKQFGILSAFKSTRLAKSYDLKSLYFFFLNAVPYQIRPCGQSSLSQPGGYIFMRVNILVCVGVCQYGYVSFLKVSTIARQQHCEL